MPERRLLWPLGLWGLDGGRVRAPAGSSSWESASSTRRNRTGGERTGFPHAGARAGAGAGPARAGRRGAFPGAAGRTSSGASTGASMTTDQGPSFHLKVTPASSREGGAFQWVQVPPGNRSSRKQPEQSWR